MKTAHSSKRKGFTIVEVALVLAIAGLIFLMVFIALPALQRTQRDAARREDISTLLSAIKKYQTNNRGALPTGTGTTSWDSSWNTTKPTTGWANLYYAYLGEDFTDPDGANYVLNVVACNGSGQGKECASTNTIEDATFPNGHVITIATQATCDGSMAVASANPRKVAAVYKLQGAGAYCSNT